MARINNATETQPGIPSSIPGLDRDPIDFLVATSVWIQTNLDAWIAAGLDRVILDWDSPARGLVDFKARRAPAFNNAKDVGVEAADWSVRGKEGLFWRKLFEIDAVSFLPVCSR